jgi:hypothetical protein
MNEPAVLDGAKVEIDVGDGCAPGRWETLPGVRSVRLHPGEAREALQIELEGPEADEAIDLVRGAMTYPIAIDVKLTSAAGEQWTFNGAVDDPLERPTIRMAANGSITRVSTSSPA